MGDIAASVRWDQFAITAGVLVVLGILHLAVFRPWERKLARWRAQQVERVAEQRWLGDAMGASGSINSALMHRLLGSSGADGGIEEHLDLLEKIRPLLVRHAEVRENLERLVRIARDFPSAVPSGDGAELTKRLQELQQIHAVVSDAYFDAFRASMADRRIDPLRRGRTSPAPDPGRPSRADLPLATFLTVQSVLFCSHILVTVFFLGRPIGSALYGYAVCLGIIGVLFTLSLRTIRSPRLLDTRPHHPRFPDGKHPRPKLQFTMGMLLFSGLQLLIFWPWSKR